MLKSLKSKHQNKKTIMQPIPVKVKNVSVYPYLGVGIGPVVPPVIEAAKGTYAVGTLAMSVYYNLDLSGGKRLKDIVVHGQYIAHGEYENGSPFVSVWMYCLDAGKDPKFGRTITIGATADNPEGAGLSLSVPAYIKLGTLTDITVSQLFPPPAIGQRLLIQGGKGNIIATRTGTPHEMGVEVAGGKRFGNLSAGMKNIIITGKTKDGHNFTVTNETCVDAGDPAVFFRLFP
jgi:hypothetical protein